MAGEVGGLNGWVAEDRAQSKEANVAVATAKWGMWLPVAAAGAVAAYALTRRHTPRASGRGTGVLADRESDTRQELGGSAGVHVEESVVINRPVAEVYRFWRDFENLPRFMKHLDSVAVREAGVSHWVAKGPGGIKVEWDARIINEVHNKIIGWQSLEGSMISTAGSVHFDETAQGTRVTVHLQFSPPAGKLGAALARFAGSDPGRQVREDLHRLKELMGDSRQ